MTPHHRRRRSRLVVAGVVVFALGFAALAVAFTVASGHYSLPLRTLAALGGAMVVGGAVLFAEGMPL